VLLGALTLLGIFAFAVWSWSAPRTHVPVPGPNATPEQVVRAYVSAINARDFATANAIDSREHSDLGRFSRPGRMEGMDSVSMGVEGQRTHVVFKANISGGDASMSDGHQWWGYVLERGADGRWFVVDAGVA
jgi:hypothetical protein